MFSKQNTQTQNLCQDVVQKPIDATAPASNPNISKLQKALHVLCDQNQNLTTTSAATVPSKTTVKVNTCGGASRPTYLEMIYAALSTSDDAIQTNVQNTAEAPNEQKFMSPYKTHRANESAAASLTPFISKGVSNDEDLGGKKKMMVMRARHSDRFLA